MFLESQPTFPEYSLNCFQVRTGQTLIEQAKMIDSSDIRVMAHAAEASSQRELFQELSKKHAVVVSTGAS